MAEGGRSLNDDQLGPYLRKPKCNKCDQDATTQVIECGHSFCDRCYHSLYDQRLGKFMCLCNRGHDQYHHRDDQSQRIANLEAELASLRAHVKRLGVDVPGMAETDTPADDVESPHMVEEEDSRQRTSHFDYRDIYLPRRLPSRSRNRGSTSIPSSGVSGRRSLDSATSRNRDGTSSGPGSVGLPEGMSEEPPVESSNEEE